MSKMYFSRLHLSLPDNTQKKPFIIDGIRSAAAAAYNNYGYKIIDLETTGAYISGYMVKYDPHGRGEYVDERTGTAKPGGTPNAIVAKALFLINLDEMLIAFEETQNLISKTMFLRMFKELFDINHKEKIYDFSISAITEQYSFIEEVMTLKEIKKVSISLVPSNPNNADLWRATDEKLRENNITRYREVQESNSKEGIIIDNETKAKMAMSEDGYGSAEAVGTNQFGHEVSITTKTGNKAVVQNFPDEVEKSGIKAIIDYLSDTFERIIKRTDHQK